MSYAVIHMQKIKGNGIKGMQIHNQREKESETNPDIQKDKSHLNYDLENENEIDYNQKVNQMINDHVDQSKRKVRKDAVKLASFLVTSDKEFFDRIGEREEKRFFETARNFIADRYGKENVAYAMVHKDEKTPHMHVGIVPITEDNRLSAKDFFGKKQQLHKLQDDFHAHMKEHGFDLERGVSSDRKHLETAKFKLKTTQEQTKKLEENLEKLKTIETKINEIDDIDKKTKEIPLAKQIVISKADFEEIKEVAKYGVAIRQNYEELKESNSIQTKEFKEHIKTVEQERDDAFSHAEKMGKKLNVLERKYEQVSEENAYLKGVLHQVVAFSKDKIQNFSKVMGAIKYNTLDKLEKYFRKDLSHLKKFDNELEQQGFEAIAKKEKEKEKDLAAEPELE